MFVFIFYRPCPLSVDCCKGVELGQTESHHGTKSEPIMSPPSNTTSGAKTIPLASIKRKLTSV